MVRNLTRQTVVAQRPVIASNPFARMRGMIARRFDGFDAMVFPQCHSVHTWFMTRPIGLLFLDRENRVLRIAAAARPWRIWLGPPGACSVIELPPGAATELLVQKGDQLEWMNVFDEKPAMQIRLIFAGFIAGCFMAGATLVLLSLLPQEAESARRIYGLFHWPEIQIVGLLTKLFHPHNADQGLRFILPVHFAYWGLAGSMVGWIAGIINHWMRKGSGRWLG
ncbi:MAG: DUF192 domain-containing protein [Verrucomicrobiae bacterium]|nr:DUF192 domain-containing protein [Verrucomicrobiae bacterium]